MSVGKSGRRLATGLASAAVAAAAAGWYGLAAAPPDEARPSDQQEATQHGLPALARFKVSVMGNNTQKVVALLMQRGSQSLTYSPQVASRRPDGTFPPSLYGWAADVHSRVSGALEDVSGTFFASNCKMCLVD